MNILEIKDLSKTYSNGVRALDSLNLFLREGTNLGLVGPNGAGKTTTINILAGLVKKDCGEIYIFGNKIRESDYEYKRFIGFVLEKPVYFEKLTGREYLEFVGSMFDIPRDETRRRVNNLLKLFELEEKSDELIEKYSAGMKKKVSIMAAIIHNPKLLILDEPLEGLDPMSSKLVKDILRSMVNRGASVLISSHYLDMVERFCDEVAIINKGRIVFQDRTEYIQKRIKDEISKETYATLEEIFIKVVSDNSGVKDVRKEIDWI